MVKKIYFILFNLFRIVIENLLKVLIQRNKNLVVMGLRTPITKLNNVSNDYFMHSTKLLLLCSNSLNLQNLKIIYLCDDETMINSFITHGYKNVFKRKSLKGLYYSLIAKYWLYDDTKFGVNHPLLSGGATCINLWHGVSWKKFGYDSTNKINNLKKISKQFFKLFASKEKYVISNNEFETHCFETAFLSKTDDIKNLGAPRYDMFFQDIHNIELFMEEDFYNIKSLKKQGKKVFLYMPTFRDTGKDISSWLKSNELKEFLIKNNAIMVCKLHFADVNTLNFELGDCFYKMNKNSDAYAIFKYTDAIISDYSSAAIDYLLVDKPIIYHVPDLEEYQEQCRGFYLPYDDLVAGVKTKTTDEIISAMTKIVDGRDDYKNERKKLRDWFFKFQDGKNCERVIEFIKSLDK